MGLRGAGHEEVSRALFGAEAFEGTVTLNGKAPDLASPRAALKSGKATAFLGQKNIHYGVDRIVAITQDGRGYAWQELNNCGEKAYDGTVVGEDCPPREN